MRTGTVVVAAALALSGCRSDSDSAATPDAAPVTPSSSPSPSVADHSARALVRDPRAHLLSWAFDGHGDLLGVWSRGFGQYPVEAFAVRRPSGRTAVRRAPSSSSIAAHLRHGWLVVTRGRHRGVVHRVGPHAELKVPGVAHHRGRPHAGDVAVALVGRPLLYRPSTDRLYAVPGPPLRHPTGGYVTPEGRLVVVGGAARWAAYDGRGWATGHWGLGDVADTVAGAGDTVVAVLGRSLADGVDATGVAGVAVSHDGGRTWQVRSAPAQIVEALSLVVMPDGTAFLSTGSGQLVRVPWQGRPVVVPGIRPISLSSEGQRLYALTSSDRRFTRLHLQVSVDAGRTWSSVPLPGR